jgi:hypothetical protein
MRTLTENREFLDRLVNVLLEKETIGADELDRLVTGEPEPPSLTPSEPPAPSAPSPVVQRRWREGKRCALPVAV